MKSIYNFIIEPIEGRYNNNIKVGDKELILNTSIEDHKFVNRRAKVLNVPIAFKTDITNGDVVVVHHNIFRRLYNMKGVEKFSSSFFKDNMYFCTIDQIYLYKRHGMYIPNLNYCFVKPILNKSNLITDNEKPLTGIIKYISKSLESKGLTNGALITFKPDCEFEFIIDNERLYCMKSNNIVIEHEYQGDEEEYNPSWASSG